MAGGGSSCSFLCFSYKKVEMLFIAIYCQNLTCQAYQFSQVIPGFTKVMQEQKAFFLGYVFDDIWYIQASSSTTCKCR